MSVFVFPYFPRVSGPYTAPTNRNYVAQLSTFGVILYVWPFERKPIAITPQEVQNIKPSSSRLILSKFFFVFEESIQGQFKSFANTKW